MSDLFKYNTFSIMHSKKGKFTSLLNVLYMNWYKLSRKFNNVDELFYHIDNILNLILSDKNIYLKKEPKIMNNIIVFSLSNDEDSVRVQMKLDGNFFSIIAIKNGTEAIYSKRENAAMIDPYTEINNITNLI